MDELLSLPDLEFLVRVGGRLGLAAVLGGLLGAEREWVGKSAGLRTHMMVALGAAAFMIAPLEAGVQLANLTSTIQGVATGIGFIGAGTILKRKDREEIEGLTTAATIWLTGAIGIAAGTGQTWLAVICALGAWVILSILGGVEGWMQRKQSR